MIRAGITGWGKAMPPTVLSNSDLEKIADTSDDWITARTGIKERRITHIEPSDLATIAGRRALAAAGLEPEDLDMVINATCTPESLIPASASYVQTKIGAKNAAAMDLNANCSGFIYALVTAGAMITAGTLRKVLLIGVEKLSYILDFNVRSTCVLFGDGAGAVVLEPVENGAGGLLASELGVDGSVAEILRVKEMGTVGGPGPRNPANASIYMEGQEVFRRAVTKMGESAVKVVEGSGWKLEEVDLLIPHQANQRIIDATARRLKLDDSQVYVNIHAYGNTSAATIPVALSEALEQGMVRPGANIVFAGFGGGLTWAAAALTWGERITPIAEAEVEIPATEKSLWEILEPNFEFFGYPDTATELAS